MDTTQPKPQPNLDALQVPASQGAGAVQSTASPTNPKAPTKLKDKTCFVSSDRRVVVKLLVEMLQRHPPSKYPCVVLQVFPEDHTRIRAIPGGGVECMFAHDELDAFLTAFNAAAVSQGKGEIYKILQSVPSKTAERKAVWKSHNETRLGLRPTPWWWRSKRRDRN
jgi:hypothetical protein